MQNPDQDRVRAGAAPDSIPDSVPASASIPIFAICIAAAIALAVAMGVGRFAFTPLLPLMVRDGVLGGNDGAWIAASNYLGYLVGAMVAARLPFSMLTLLAASLVGIVLTTAGMGLGNAFSVWALLRFGAGVLSAWGLVSTSAWVLGHLARAGRPHLAGVVYTGVGLGIALTGAYCLVAARPGVQAAQLWLELGLLAALASAFPLVLSRRAGLPHARLPSQPRPPQPPGTQGRVVAAIIVGYALFGFGYILPATFLPAMARELVDDPRVFGWAWPLFGLAGALSTLFMAWRLGRANRLRVWAVAQALMGLGVLLPSLWLSLPSVVLAAFLVGGTFMVVTVLALQEGNARGGVNPTRLLALMTAVFALGQLLGPLLPVALELVTAGPERALAHALQFGAAGLLLSALLLWRVSAD